MVHNLWSKFFHPIVCLLLQSVFIFITNVFLEHIVYLSIWRKRIQKYWFQLQLTRSVTMYHQLQMKVKVSHRLQMWSSSHLIKAYHRLWLTQLACLCLWWHTDLIQKWSQTLISVVIALSWISQLVQAQHCSAPHPRHWAAAERSLQIHLGTSSWPGAIRGLPRSGIAFSPVSEAEFIFKPFLSWISSTCGCELGEVTTQVIFQHPDVYWQPSWASPTPHHSSPWLFLTLSMSCTEI